MWTGVSALLVGALLAAPAWWFMAPRPKQSGSCAVARDSSLDATTTSTDPAPPNRGRGPES